MLNKKSLSRVFLFLILGIFVFYYITPLYVMIVTSLKTMNEIRDGNLFSFPNAINFDAWKIAWAGRGEGTSDTYLKPYFLNSLKITIVESSEYGIVGVGEGSTEHWVGFMDHCNISVYDLIKETGDTYKTWINFQDWKGVGTCYWHS